MASDSLWRTVVVVSQVVLLALCTLAGSQETTTLCRTMTSSQKVRSLCYVIYVHLNSLLIIKLQHYFQYDATQYSEVCSQKELVLLRLTIT